MKPKAPVHCIYCDATYTWKIKRPFLPGTKYFICPECNNYNYITLTRNEKRGYIAFGLFFLVLFFGNLVQWVLVLPWLLFIAPLLTYLKNKKAELFNTKIAENKSNWKIIGNTIFEWDITEDILKLEELYINPTGANKKEPIETKEDTIPDKVFIQWSNTKNTKLLQIIWVIVIIIVVISLL